MPQKNYTVSASQSGLAYASDINDVFEAIQTNNSGATAPTDLKAFQTWADTATNFLKMRNAGNTGFIDAFPLDKNLSVYISELLNAYGVGGTAPLKQSDNLNTVDATGFYRITPSTLNNPYGTGSVLVIRRDSGVADQMIISLTDSKVYFRSTQNSGSLWTVLGSFVDLSTQVNSNTAKITTLETIGVPKGYISTPTPQYATARTATINGNAVAKSGDDLYNIQASGNHTVSLDTNGLDGLFSGSVASNTWYYLYLVSLADGTGGGYLWDTTQGVTSHALGASNRILRSEELENSAWIKGGSPVATVTANQYLAPSGEVTADKITDSTDTAGSQLSQVPTPTTNQSTLSFYCKKIDTNWMRVTYAQSTNQVRLWINLNNRTLGSVTTAGTAPTNIVTTIADAGNGWDRVTLSANFASTTSMNVVFATSTGDTITTRVSGASYSVWGVQVNNGAVAEGYVRTGGSVVTGTSTFRSRQLPLAVRTDASSNIRPFYLTNWNGRQANLNYEDTIDYTLPVPTGATKVTRVTSTSFTTVSLVDFLPPSVINCRLAVRTGSADSTYEMRATGGSVTVKRRHNSTSIAPEYQDVQMRCNTSQQIDVLTSSGAAPLDVFVSGFTFNL